MPPEIKINNITSITNKLYGIFLVEVVTKNSIIRNYIKIFYLTAGRVNKNFGAVRFGARPIWRTRCVLALIYFKRSVRSNAIRATLNHRSVSS